MRFTYHDIKEDILKNYNKNKIRNLNTEERKELVKSLFRFLYLKKPEIREINLKNLVEFLTVSNLFLFYKNIEKIKLYESSFIYFTDLHKNLCVVDKYRNRYKKLCKVIQRTRRN